MSFNSERRAFATLLECYSQDALDEYVTAIRTLLERYNTTIYENRFVVGGAVEIFTCALLRTTGLAVNLYAAEEKSGDLLLPQGKHLSVKGSFAGGPQDVKLINQLGSGERAWDTATLFVISEVGIVYGDPGLVAAEHIKQTADGVVLKRAAIKALIEDTNNVLAADIPRKPPTQMTGFSHKASAAVARQVLSATQARQLLVMVDKIGAG